MSDTAAEIQRAGAVVLTQLSQTAPELAFDAATPLDTLPPDLVALIVNRVNAGATAFGTDQPRAPIIWRVVVPSIVLAVLDAAGLVAAAITGRYVLAVVAAVLLVVLSYLARAGVRFVREDPLRVTGEQRARVGEARHWNSSQTWTDEQRSGSWCRLVASAAAATVRIAGSDAWTWVALSDQRSQTQLAQLLDVLDAEAIALARSGQDVPASTSEDDAGARLLTRVAALHSYADALDDVVRRAATKVELRTELPPADRARLAGLIDTARGPAALDTEPS